MAQIRATKDPGIAVDFSHSDVEQIKDAAEPVPVIQEKVVKAAVIVPAAGPTMTEAASSIAEAIALRKEELVRTDGGHGVEVVFDVQALTLGDWDIIAVRPLPSTVPSVSMVETFSLVSSSPPTAAEAGEVLFVFAVAEDRRIVFNEVAADGGFTGWQEVPGGLLTRTAPAAATLGDEAVVFATSPEGRILVNRVAPDRSFSGWQEIPGELTVDAAPSATRQGEGLLLFARAPDARILFNQLASDGSFSGWQERSVRFA
ncbi:hypothetical protein [Actinacidiphila oryziradicis]|jgi:hypothetical protein|uniref:Uncharacterized protein n=1 Tax=Actinacidiphila oryziradicis TaxID=2571141 RepID=A0A4U0SJD5_9ACTN|nr:hypothetical protein [Actinacidiphila oryziradicis]TKA09243.1 hypothetical protein FCI23_23095 [Actinacidiphila oryziradicis]